MDLVLLAIPQNVLVGKNADFLIFVKMFSRFFIHPANPPGADQAVFAHTMMAPASSWEEEA